MEKWSQVYLATMTAVNTYLYHGLVSKEKYIKKMYVFKNIDGSGYCTPSRSYWDLFEQLRAWKKLIKTLENRGQCENWKLI